MATYIARYLALDPNGAVVGAGTTSVTCGFYDLNDVKTANAMHDFVADRIGREIGRTVLTTSIHEQAA